MCSITGSFNRERLIDLVRLNAHRGTHSNSISRYNVKERNFDIITKKLGPVVFDEIPETSDDHYLIVHQQAPTTEARSEEHIHPAFFRGRILWHNGMLKEQAIKDLQIDLNTPESWDTKLFLMKIIEDEGDIPLVDGSFSCVMYDPECKQPLSIFRNPLSPLFLGPLGDISSMRFEGSVPTEPNIEYRLDFDPHGKGIYFNAVGSFRCYDMPWYTGIGE